MTARKSRRAVWARHVAPAAGEGIFYFQVLTSLAPECNLLSAGACGPARQARREAVSAAGVLRPSISKEFSYGQIFRQVGRSSL